MALVTRQHWLERPSGISFRLLWLGLSVAIACLLIYTVAQRLSYPYPLEWLEPATADIAARIRNGLPVYCAPSIAYVSPMKTPLYYYLVAAFWPITGDGLAAGRWVSILATLGTLGLIWRFIRCEGANRLWAVFGVAFYVATYKIGDRWYDLARLDATFVFFTMAWIYGLRFWRDGLGASSSLRRSSPSRPSSWWSYRPGWHWPSRRRDASPSPP